MTTMLTAPHPLTVDRPLSARERRIINDITRREFIVGGTALSALIAAGCGDDNATDSDGTAGVRTIDFPEGTLPMTGTPRRVAVSNGRRVLPFLLPFLAADPDIEIVGFGGETGSNLPWIPAEYWQLPNSPDTDSVSVENYAKWDPDVIIANGNVGDYWDVLEPVAPLAILPETDWRLTTTLLGELFEAPSIAAGVIADTETFLTGARPAQPLKVAVLGQYQPGSLYFQYRGAELPNFLIELGFDIGEQPTATPASTGYEDPVSFEVLPELLAASDWAVITAPGEFTESFLANPLFSGSDLAQTQRFIVLDEVANQAGFPVTPASIPFLVDALRPMIDAA